MGRRIFEPTSLVGALSELSVSVGRLSELSVGRIEVALAVALIMLAMATVALAAIHWLNSGRGA